MYSGGLSSVAYKCHKITQDVRITWRREGGREGEGREDGTEACIIVDIPVLNLLWSEHICCTIGFVC